MSRKLSLSLLTILFLVTLTLTSATTARALTLAELIDPNCTICSITVDDKLFDNFTFSMFSTDLNLTTPDDASGINVGPIVVGSEIGLAFTGGMTAQNGATLDLVIGYKVTVLDPNRLLSDIELIFNGNASPGSHTSVVETVLDANPPPNTPALIGEATVMDPPNGAHDELILLDRQVRSALVQKDIILQAAANNIFFAGNVTISVVDQLFSQTRPPQDIPEPASLLLLGSGLAFIVRSRRRHIG